LEKFIYLKSENLDYIERLFDLYQQDPELIDPSWSYFFDGLELGNRSEFKETVESESHDSEFHVTELIANYREHGKLLADVNPLSPPPSTHPLLELSHFQLKESDLSKNFQAGNLIGLGASPLKEIIAKLKDTYCRTIGVEYPTLQNREEHTWLKTQFEALFTEEKIDPETQKRILYRLTESESFERFLHTRYVAQKRFSIEGAEALLPSLDCLIETGANLGAEEFVIGMAHRGRLNVLTHVFGKKPELIFSEFEGHSPIHFSQGEGDVKYHLGYSNDFKTLSGKKVHLLLASNPSHLEFVNPVIEGLVRAKQENLKDTQRKKVIPINIHGDAAFAGQGVCFETLNLSQLLGYQTGGTLHIVINNQIGFTTSPMDSRSTSYATDLAKVLDAPVFHVNGDDPEALWLISKLCMQYRQKFGKDIFIDLICYRKHGHNEGDEPSFTQPLLYKKIKTHPSTREIYAQHLAKKGVLSLEESQNWIQTVTSKLSEAQAQSKANLGHSSPGSAAEKKDPLKSVTTAVSADILKELSQKLNQIPKSFQLHPKLGRFFETRLKSVEEGKGIDWGTGEALAFASLLIEGHPVRLSGQDVERGTFTHRHAVLHDYNTGETYVPLNHLGKDQAPFHVHNSHLSETGVLGFEYGYSLATPDTLTLWEAQFGDFANGAQVIIDQFLSSSESKWQQTSGLTLLLPHGLEGQGPEHSSARLERFLQLCGRDNMIVANLTTPAQIFHAFRRQIKRSFRKPLVIMSPKSLLRHPSATSQLKEFTEGGFEEVLDDPNWTISGASHSMDQTINLAIEKVILCSGKIFYQLASEQIAKKINTIAIIRIEQLYPWPEEKLQKILSRYPKAKIFWAQEEPRNMGAWSFVFELWGGSDSGFYEKAEGRPIHYIGRGIGAAPAVGSSKVHEIEQIELIEKVLK
jgi:2-oxoglutarate dehydrogenase E1 component